MAHLSNSCKEFPLWLLLNVQPVPYRWDFFQFFFGCYQNTEMTTCTPLSLCTSLIISSGKLPGQFSSNIFIILIFTIRFYSLCNAHCFLCPESMWRGSQMCWAPAGSVWVPKCPAEGDQGMGGRERGSCTQSVSGLPPPGSGKGGGLGECSRKGPHSLCVLAPACSGEPLRPMSWPL